MLVFTHVNEQTQMNLLSVMQHCIADTCNGATSSMDTVLILQGVCSVVTV